MITRLAVTVKGIVQGVGFRPFVYRLANERALAGFVQNTPYGVYIEIEGPAAACHSFIHALTDSPPPMAVIDETNGSEIQPTGQKDFTIIKSSGGAPAAAVSPDIGLCDDCAKEILDPANRRYGYPFTNCTNCGPRYSIIERVPYDRKNTAMAGFVMCKDCQDEYDDPGDRRFHAQPNACERCGPQLRLLGKDGAVPGEPIIQFTKIIQAGGIAAVKGIGGFHLACDAFHETAVQTLRERKLRYDKAFAVLFKDIQTAAEYCEINEEERALLLSPQRPIVLLRCKKPLAKGVAPHTNRLGVMLPYTPLHLLIMREFKALVMTSGNFSDSPMIYKDEEIPVLFSLADTVLTHNRPIVRRVDDSVCMVVGGVPRFLRRARGFAPQAVAFSGGENDILALGAQQKNTFCITKGDSAYLSGHIGDLDEADTEESYEAAIPAHLALFGAAPVAVAYDMHPDYISSRYAKTFAARAQLIPVQHHHAHFASALAEKKKTEQDYLGFIFDGTGYGEDQTIWGGEMLFGGIKQVKRVGHLLPFCLPGGEAAIHEPWRVAAGMMAKALGEETAKDFFAGRAGMDVILRLAGGGQYAPVTTSMGRLFDAVAAIAGVRTTVNHEGQAAEELEQILDVNSTGAYSLPVCEEDGVLLFDWRALVRQAVQDAEGGAKPGTVSARFHRGIITMVCRAAGLFAEKTEVAGVVLSGGVFQNAYLLDGCARGLAAMGMAVYTNEKVPAGDGGISYGQAAVAAARLR